VDPAGHPRSSGPTTHAPADRDPVPEDLSDLEEIEADAAERVENLDELEEIDENLQEGWQEYGEEAEEEVEVEAEPELSLDHLMREEEGPEAGDVEEGEVRMHLTVVNELAREPQPDEFLCLSCFLLKKRTQLADAHRMRCRDCMDPA
jgi:hypothetical protein